jgi:hypothetical protein
MLTLLLLSPILCMPRFIVQSDVTAQIAPTTVLLIALQTNLMAQTLREAMDGRLIYTPINQFSWLCTDFCLALLFRTPTTRKSYLLTTGRRRMRNANYTYCYQLKSFPEMSSHYHVACDQKHHLLHFGASEVNISRISCSRKGKMGSNSPWVGLLMDMERRLRWSV